MAEMNHGELDAGMMSTEPPPNYLLAAAAGLGGGIVAAFLYAIISFSIEREFLILIVGIGIGVGIAIRWILKRENVVTGLIAVVMAAASILAAIVLLVAFYAAGSIGDGLSRVGEINVGVAVDLYFSDPQGYIWVFAGLLAAFYVASGWSKRDAARKAAAAHEKEMKKNPPQD